ncbi:MAG: zinc ribbon domain-containing protein [Nitrospirae bacterium]|nr:zinc ribbon domain-containing protein [Nitrospirota bacterium]
MPIYEYKCTKCNKQFEVNQKMADPLLTECRVCGGKLKKLITSSSFVLKGGGWYVTDYPSADRKKAMDKKKEKKAEGKDETPTKKDAAKKEAVKKE